MIDTLKKIFNSNKPVDENAILEERIKLVDRFNAITEETSLDDVLQLRKEWKSFNDSLHSLSNEIDKKYSIYLTSEQHNICDKIINSQSTIYRTRRCSSNTEYIKEYGLWKIPFKGQKPVDVKKLNDSKARYERFKSEPKNNLENRRKRRFEDIAHWNSKKSKPSVIGWDGFNHWLYWFKGVGDWYHRDAVQEMRDIIKLLPSYNSTYVRYSNIDGDVTLVLLKKNNRRNNYLDESQWKNIVEFIKLHNTNIFIKKIFFGKEISTYTENVKIRDKEWKFIENAGCSFIDDVESDMWFEEYHNISKRRKIQGKSFEINY